MNVDFPAYVRKQGKDPYNLTPTEEAAMLEAMIGELRTSETSDPETSTIQDLMEQADPDDTDQSSGLEIDDDEWEQLIRREKAIRDWESSDNELPVDHRKTRQLFQEMSQEQQQTIRKHVDQVYESGWGVICIGTKNTPLRETKEYAAVMTARLHGRLQRSYRAISVKRFIDGLRDDGLQQALVFLHGANTSTSEAMRHQITDWLATRIADGKWTVLECGDTTSGKQLSWPPAFANLILPEAYLITL